MTVLKWLRMLLYAPLLFWYGISDRLWAPLFLRLHGVVFGPGLLLSGCPVLSVPPGGSIKLGRNVKLYSRAQTNPMQLYSPCTLWLSRSDASIHIGDECALSGAVICAATRVDIGQRVMVGANSKIMDTNFHPVSAHARRDHPTRGAKSRPVMIGDDVWIGTNVIILPGTRIGSGCVVSAGAVVSGVFPPDTLLVGNPAQVVKELLREPPIP